MDSESLALCFNCMICLCNAICLPLTSPMSSNYSYIHGTSTP